MSSPRIYFLTDGQAIKIGYSENIQQRRRDLQIGNWKELTVVGWLPAGEFEEVELHEQFSHLSIRGEWFKPGADLLEFITENCKRDLPVRGDIEAAANPVLHIDPVARQAANDFVRWANSQKFRDSALIHAASWIGCSLHRMSVAPTEVLKTELVRAMQNFESMYRPCPENGRETE